MELIQEKSDKTNIPITNIPITDKYVHAMSLQAIVASNEYEADTCEWEKIPAQEQTWAEWKKTFREAYVEKNYGIKKEMTLINFLGERLHPFPRKTVYQQDRIK